MLRALDHPALAKVYDRFVDNHKHYLVMEYVRGHNLEDELIETGRPLALGTCAVMGYRTLRCSGLPAWPNPPIIYRDLKPANVMVQPDDTIKLIDFGIARWLHPMRSHDTSKLGTDGYAPLEQYNARSEPRSDLYALGASLYHLLTGRVPEAAPMRSIGESLTSLRSINRQVPEPLERVILARSQPAGAGSLRRRQRDAGGAGMGGESSGGRLAGGGSGGTGAPWTVSPHSGSGSPPGSTSPRLAGTTIGRSGASSFAAPKLQVRPLRLDAGYLEVDDVVVLLARGSQPGRRQLRVGLKPISTVYR